MSVLFLRRRQPREVANDWSPCDNGCVETMGRGRAVGTGGSEFARRDRLGWDTWEQHRARPRDARPARRTATS